MWWFIENILIDWNIKQYNDSIVVDSIVDDGFETTNVWNISPIKNKHHPAVFPNELCEKVIKYYSFKKDVVFDPFAGSGTVGIVSTYTDRRFILIEKEMKYVDYMRKKLPKAIFLDDDSLKKDGLN